MTTTGRKPWLAVSLSLLCPGLGHVYCGRLARGLWIFCLTLVLAPDALVVAYAPPSRPMLALLCASALASLGLAVFAAADSWRIANRLRDEFTPREYQRPSVYAAFLFVGMVCPSVSGLLLGAYVFSAYKIASGSMAPTLVAGDRIIANRLRVETGAVQRGELVVFHPPGEERVYVKRLIGLPGDRIEVKAGRVVVNGQPLPLEPLPDADGRKVFEETSGDRRYRVFLTDGSHEDVPAARLGDDQYFLMGDNRGASQDSRMFGPVRRPDLIGAAEYIFFSSKGLGRIGPLGGDR